MGKTKVFGFLGFVLGWFAFGLGRGGGLYMGKEGK